MFHVGMKAFVWYVFFFVEVGEFLLCLFFKAEMRKKLDEGALDGLSK